MWQGGRLNIVLLVLALALMTAGFGQTAFAADGGLLPTIPKALEKAEDGHAELMRRNHMNLMKHKRDQTVRQGIRTKQYSLKACVSCHAVPGPDKLPVSVESPKHFCRTCHDYAAVKIDCFQCHSSKPPSSVSLSQAQATQYGLVINNNQSTDLSTDLSGQIQGFLKR